MEGKVWILVAVELIFTGLTCTRQAYGQGFTFSEPSTENNLPQQTQHQAYLTYNQSIDSQVTIPCYTYKGIQWFKNNAGQCNETPLYNHEVALLAANHGTGNFLHYIYSEEYLFVVNPSSGKLLVKHLESKASYSMLIDGLPFGLAYAKTRNQLYVSGLRRRSIVVIDIEHQAIQDSIEVNGASSRFLALSSDESFLFIGTRASRSIGKINLTKNKLISFSITGNQPGFMVCDSSDNLYVIQHNHNVISKFKTSDLTLLECQSLPVKPINCVRVQSLSPPQILLTRSDRYDISQIQFEDSLPSQHPFYDAMALDSSGRYTWVIGSYKNPKWALIKMTELRDRGIQCYLSPMHDGYFRLCAGLFQNQFDSVVYRDKYPEAFKGSWLMTIHPHKF